MLRIAIALVFSLIIVGLLAVLIMKKGNQPNVKVNERLKFGSEDEPKDKSPQAQAERMRRQQATRKPEDIPFRERVLLPMWQSVTSKVMRFAPSALAGVIQKQLLLAGEPARAGAVGSFLLRMLIFAVIAGVAMFWALFGQDMMAIRKLVFTGLATLFGALIPILALRSKIQKRQDEMRHQLPEVLDLLCVSVEAGLSFDAALRRIVTRMHGAFVDECRKMLDDVRMGVTKKEALVAMSDRCGVQDVALFITSVVQAERLGSNMSGILKAQADNVRDRQRQWVKAQALKAPVKIVIPLVMFILPAIFIVALAPPLFSVAKNFLK